jgi:RHS repeat-associated protein
VAIAGQVHHREFVPTPNLSWSFVWDGLDAAQRPVVGMATAAVRIDNYYRALYVPTEIFGQYPNPTALSGPTARAYKQFTRTLQASLMGRAPEGAWALGGWTLNKHHFFDPQTSTVYFGSGARQTVGLQGGSITRILGDGSSSGFAPDDTSATAAGTGLTWSEQHGVAVTPNGDVLVADVERNVIRRVDAAGKIKTIAGAVNESPCTTPPTPGDNETDATTARLERPTAMAVAPDGSVYIATSEHTVRKLRPLTNVNYAISTVTGGNYRCIHPPGFGGDGERASAARIAGPQGIAVGADGSVYIADTLNNRVRRIDPSGMMSTVAGDGTNSSLAEGLATSVPVPSPMDVAVGPDGSLYIRSGYDLVKVDRNGLLTRVTQSWDFTPVIEGVPISTQGVDGLANSVTTSPDGTLFFNDWDWQRGSVPASSTRRYIRAVDTLGIVRSIAVSSGPTPPTPPAVGSALGDALAYGGALAVAPNGDVLTAETQAIYRIQRSLLPGAGNCADQSAKYFVPSGDEGYCFDERGRHLKTIDRLTGQTRYGFTYTSALSSVTDPGGRITKVSFPAPSTIWLEAPPPTGAAAPGVQKTTIVKSTTTGWATSITDAIGGLTLTPSSSGLLQTLKDGENNTFTFKYDDSGLLTSDASPLGTQTLVRTPLAEGHRVTHTAPGTRVTKYETARNPAGVLTHTTTFPDNTTRVHVANPNGVETETSRDGVLTTKTFTAHPVYGLQVPVATLETIRLPSGLTQTIKRIFTGPSGNAETIATVYDDTVAPPVQQTIAKTYGVAGQTVTTTSPSGRTTTVQRDSVGRMTSVQIGNAVVGSLTPIVYAYPSGQLDSRTQGGRVTGYTYQSSKAEVDAGMLLRIQDPYSTTELRHDARGRLTSHEQALGTTVAAKTKTEWWKHDAVWKVLTPRSTGPSSMVHQFTYDQTKQLQQYLPPVTPTVAAPATNYGYTNGLLTSETPPGLGAITLTYVTTPSNTSLPNVVTLPATSLANLAGAIDHDYYTTTNASTGAAAGRISRITFPATLTLDYKYDGPLLTSQKWSGDVAGEVTRTYSNRFFISQEAVKVGTGALVPHYLGYDKDGLLTCVSPTTCAPAGADALRLTYSPIHGQVATVTAGSVTETLTYSDTAADRSNNPPTAFGELRRQSVTEIASGTTVASITYDQPAGALAGPRDAMGRIRYKWETFRNAATGINETAKWEYRYDERGQLKTVLLNGSQVEAFVYDANGNRAQTFTTVGSTATIWTVDDQDRLTNVGGKGGDLTYSAKGEVRTMPDKSVYHYDALGRLRTVIPVAGTTIEYTLDGEGRRVAKKKNGVFVKRWLYRDGLSPIAELDGSGNLVSRFVYGSRKNVPDRILRDGKSYRLISDQLGSPRYAVNESNINDVPYHVSWGPFGTPSVSGGLTVAALDWIPFGFAGGLYDRETGLLHFGARDYSPQLNRWLSKDPINFRGGDANLYAYVGNDPVNRIDPTGLWYIDVNFGGGSVVGGTGGVYLGPGGANPYAGGGFVSPGVGGSICYGGGSPSPGMSSGQASIGFIFPFGLGPVFAWGNDATGATFWEVGIGFGTPGPAVSGVGYWTW